MDQFLLLLILLRRLDYFIDCASHVERLLRHFVVLALEDFLEAFDRVFELDVLAFAAGEL